MPDCTCYYCGKPITAREDLSLKRKLAVHLRDCPVRKNGISFDVNGRSFLIKLRSVKTLQLIQVFQKKAESFPGDPASLFLGFSYALKETGRIRSVKMLEPAPAAPAAG